MICPNCKQVVEDTSEFCVYCGTLLNNAPHNKDGTPSAPEVKRHLNKKWITVIVAMLIACAVVVCVFAGIQFVSYQQTKALRDAIEHEWFGMRGPNDAMQVFDIDASTISYSLLVTNLGEIEVEEYRWKPIDDTTIRVWASDGTSQNHTIDVREADDGSYVAMEIRPALDYEEVLDIWIRLT